MWSLVIDLEARLKGVMVGFLKDCGAPTPAIINAVRVSLATYLAALELDSKRVDAIYRHAWGDSEMRRFVHDIVVVAAQATNPKAVPDLIRVLSYVDSQFRSLDAPAIAAGLLQPDDAVRTAHLISTAGAFGCRDGIADELTRVRAATRHVAAYTERELKLRVFWLKEFVENTNPRLAVALTSRGLPYDEAMLAQAARTAAGITSRVALRYELLEDLLDVALPGNQRLRWASDIFDALAADYLNVPVPRQAEVARIVFERLALVFPGLSEVGEGVVANHMLQLVPAGSKKPQRRLAVLADILRHAGESVSARQLREARRAKKRTTRRSRR